jgi:hypothetical protein
MPAAEICVESDDSDIDHKYGEGDKEPDSDNEEPQGEGQGRYMHFLHCNLTGDHRLGEPLCPLHRSNWSTHFWIFPALCRGMKARGMETTPVARETECSGDPITEGR